MCLIVPPSIHRNLLENGNSDQRDIATRTLRALKGFNLSRLVSLRDTLLAPPDFEVNLFGKKAEKNRSTYDAENKTKLPGTLVRKEGAGPVNDRDTDKAHDDTGLTWDFLHKIYGRNSLDDKGMELPLTVHYGRNFGNAFWNSRQIVLGDGDGEVFQTFVITDVIGHEWAHCLTEKTAGLVYRNQPGGLNESFSDVFGSMVKQYSLNQTAEQADWLIGEGLFTPQINGKALRSMSNPGSAFDDPLIGKDRQVDHISKYDDSLDVHFSSGISNKAFYTAAMEIGGFSWERAGKIWYNVLSQELKPTSKFQDCADATIKVASKLYGKTSKEVKAVRNGWKAVGITV